MKLRCRTFWISNFGTRRNSTGNNFSNVWNKVLFLRLFYFVTKTLLQKMDLAKISQAFRLKFFKNWGKNVFQNWTPNVVTTLIIHSKVNLGPKNTLRWFISSPGFENLVNRAHILPKNPFFQKSANSKHLSIIRIGIFQNTRKPILVCGIHFGDVYFAFVCRNFDTRLVLSDFWEKSLRMYKKMWKSSSSKEIFFWVEIPFWSHSLSERCAWGKSRQVDSTTNTFCLHIWDVFWISKEYFVDK